jgi:hypothetical protein
LGCVVLQLAQRSLDCLDAVVGIHIGAGIERRLSNARRRAGECRRERAAADG